MTYPSRVLFLTSVTFSLSWQITDIFHDLVNDIVTLTSEGITDTTYAINLSAGLTTVGDPSGWKNSAILRSLPKPLEPIRTLAHRVQE